ncbi:MAG: ABC transporter permease [Flavobacteriales bacterium]|nr:ABC transporter permease [Flavobacteriales bacterium]
MHKSSEDRFQKRRLRNTYFSVVISISLVLFLVGILGALLLNSKKVADHFKEQIALTLYINDSVKEIEVQQLIKTLRLNTATKKVVWVSKEEASQIHTNEIGEDFMEFLGYNPLLASVDVYFNADYATPSFVKNISASFENNSFVDEIIYDQPLLELLDANIQKISYWLLFAAVLFVVVAMLLINSSIRLSIHSKRFVIKTMQLVGAHKRFIRRPFIRTHVQLGLAASLIASAGIAAVVWELDQRFPELQILRHPEEPAIILGIVVALGLSITYFSTYFATQLYLNLKTDAVY